MKEYWDLRIVQVTRDPNAKLSRDEMDALRDRYYLEQQAFLDLGDLCQLSPEQRECDLCNARLYLSLRREARTWPSEEQLQIVRENAGKHVEKAMAELDTAESPAAKREAEKHRHEGHAAIGFVDRARQFNARYQKELRELQELLPLHVREAIDQTVAKDEPILSFPVGLLEIFTPDPAAKPQPEKSTTPAPATKRAK